MGVVVGSKRSGVFQGALMAGVVGLMAVAGGQAVASPVTVVNGGFETLQTPANGSAEIGSAFSNYQNVTGWTTSAYAFVFTSATSTTPSSGTTADTTGARNQYGEQLKIWGPGDGSANGLTASPAGGNFISGDGAYNNAPITQTIAGLSPGSVAQVSFYYAGAQQYGFNGATTEAWDVSLGGGAAQRTAIVNTPSHGFSGWQSATLSFVVTSASETLSFLAYGTPNGVPPFTLLDGVSINQVPEPSTVAMVLTGLSLAAFAARRRGALRG